MVHDLVDDHVGVAYGCIGCIARVLGGIVSVKGAILAHKKTGQRLTDTSSSFRAYNRRAIVFCADHYPQGFLESVESLVLLTRAGLTVQEVPVVIRQREAGSSSLSLGRTMVYTGKVLLAIAVSLTQSAITPREDVHR